MSKPLPIYDTVATDLQSVKQRIIALLRAGWCKRYLGLDDNGNDIISIANLKCGKDVCKVCLVGAIHRANIEPFVYFFNKIHEVTNKKYVCTPTFFNDNIAKNVNDVIKLVEQVN